jgi:CheY-like chemotaxis protein/DNA-binding XRE family transcriptional regulator
MRSEQTVTRTFQARFGSVVRSQRLNDGLSQEELAHRSGLHRTYVTDVERGARNPSLNSIKKLSDALGVSLSALFGLVEGVDGKAQLPGGAGGQKRSARNGSVDILVAGDPSSGVESMLRSVNANLTNSIQFVRDGQETLDYVFGTGTFKKRDILKTPDVLILDLGLTNVGSLEVLSKLRENPITSSIAIIALASQSDQDLGRAKELGITDVITMPIDVSKFVRALTQAGYQLSVVNGPEQR